MKSPTPQSPRPIPEQNNSPKIQQLTIITRTIREIGAPFPCKIQTDRARSVECMGRRSRSLAIHSSGSVRIPRRRRQRVTTTTRCHSSTVVDLQTDATGYHVRTQRQSLNSINTTNIAQIKIHFLRLLQILQSRKNFVDSRATKDPGKCRTQVITSIILTH